MHETLVDVRTGRSRRRRAAGLGLDHDGCVCRVYEERDTRRR